MQNLSVINLTAHPVNVVGEDGSSINTYPPSGQVARLTANVVSAGTLPDGTPLTRTEFGEPTGLPDRQEGVMFIVSAMVFNALPERVDLLIPNQVVRDESGRVIGCLSLATR